ncbi:MAG TPA: hypothetical protein VLE97_02470 [Gaiellaceae bacterium]|nr:hypothetical protein [Gaiellaceae bacterium]
MPVSYGRVDPRVLGITRTLLLRSARVVDAARERAEITWETLRVRSSVTVEARRVHAALAVLELQRRDALLALGEATHRADEQAGDEAQKLLAALDARESDLRAQLQAQVEEAAERIREAKLSVGKTVVAPPPD